MTTNSPLPLPTIQRDARGRLLPGGPSLNPGGRANDLSEVRALLRPNAPLFVERLIELVKNPDPDIALPALREAFDRLLGKPVATVETDVRTMDVNEAIRQMWLAAVQQSSADHLAGLADETKTIDDVPIDEQRGRR
jgi:hypothetical protein